MDSRRDTNRLVLRSYSAIAAEWGEIYNYEYNYFTILVDTIA
jgi:hypothetical protein